MKTRFEATSSPNAGPRRSSTRSGTCSPPRSTPAGRARRWSCSITLGWPRSDIAEVERRLRRRGCRPASSSTDPDGQTVPTQILESTRYADGGLKTARVAFVARDVPAMGYSTYHVSPHACASRAAPIGGAHPGDGGAARSTLENELYRVTLDRATGAITSLRVKPGDWEVLSGPGNVVAREQDRGDLWELYKGLDGGSRVAMTTRAEGARARAGGLQRRGQGRSGDGDQRPGLLRVSSRAPVRLRSVRDDGSAFPGLRRIEITTRLVNQEKYVRYQVHVPDDDPGRARARTRFPSGRSTARPPSSSPRRTGLTTATAAAGSPCSISACPATSSPTAR